MTTTTNLTGRVAYCGSGWDWETGTPTPGHAPRPSSPDLAFFEYDGDGSRWTEHCATCGFMPCAHEPINPATGRPGITDHEYAPRPPKAWDRYYCGCRGWD